jgi:hypothetical protein
MWSKIKEIIAEKKKKDELKKEAKRKSRPTTFENPAQMLPALILNLYQKPFKPCGGKATIHSSLTSSSEKSISEFKNQCTHGMVFSERPRIWRVLSNYIPLSSPNESAILTKKRIEYKDYALKNNDTEVMKDNDAILIETLKLIKKDVMRTMPDSIVFRNKVIQSSLTRLLLTYSIRSPN